LLQSATNIERSRDTAGIPAKDTWAFTPKIVDASSSQSSTICSRRTKSVFSTTFTKIDDVISTHFNVGQQLACAALTKSFQILHKTEIPETV